MEQAIDPSVLDYDAWLSYFFDQPLVRAPDGQPPAWDKCVLHLEYRTPVRMIEHVQQLCLDFETLPTRYDWPQIDHGVWGVLSNPGWVAELLFDKTIPPDRQIACLRSMPHVFERVVTRIPDDTPLENIFFMWWDLICDGFRSEHQGWAEPPREPTEPAVRRVHDTLLEVLKRILDVPDDRCQQCALHGLGHLHHPEKAAVVRRWLDANRHRLDRDAVAWVEQCADGTVM